MQTLVYENYNKFISATDTIKKVSYTFSSLRRLRVYPSWCADNFNEDTGFSNFSQSEGFACFKECEKEPDEQ